METVPGSRYKTVYHDTIFRTAKNTKMGLQSGKELRSDAKLTKNTLRLNLTSWVWCIYCECFHDLGYIDS